MRQRQLGFAELEAFDETADEVRAIEKLGFVAVPDDRRHRDRRIGQRSHHARLPHDVGRARDFHTGWCDAHDELSGGRRAFGAALEDEAVAEACMTRQRLERMRPRARVAGLRAHQFRELRGYLFNISGHRGSRSSWLTLHPGFRRCRMQARLGAGAGIDALEPCVHVLERRIERLFDADAEVERAIQNDVGDSEAIACNVLRWRGYWL